MERYDIDWNSIDDGYAITMAPSKFGDWVKFEEHDEEIDDLKETIRVLEAEIEQLKGEK